MGDLLSEIEQLLKGEHGDPFRLLGLHRVQEGGKSGMAVRAFLPQAQEVQVVPAGGPGAVQAMRKMHVEGFFEAFFPGIEEIFNYQFLVKTAEGSKQHVDDPYRFPPILSEFDLYLMAEGNHRELYEKLGAHVLEIEGVRGVLFAVWAPNAKVVSVVGDFNEWMAGGIP